MHDFDPTMRLRVVTRRYKRRCVTVREMKEGPEALARELDYDVIDKLTSGLLIEDIETQDDCGKLASVVGNHFVSRLWMEL